MSRVISRAIRVYKSLCFRFRSLQKCLQKSDASSKGGAKASENWRGTGSLPVGLFARWASGTRTSRILTLIYILGCASIYRGGRETGPILHTGPPARVVSPFVGIAVGHCVADPEKVAQNALGRTRRSIRQENGPSIRA